MKPTPLITQVDIHKKAVRFWNNGDICRAWLNDHDIYPLALTFRKPSSLEMLENFDQVRDWIMQLQQSSKLECGKAYSLEFKRVQHRKVGEQKIPSRLYFENQNDFLGFIAKTKEFSVFKTLASQTLASFPQLTAWLNRYPFKLLNHADIWLQLLLVCSWFLENPKPKCYIRELNIQGVDSKFIEHNKDILAELLNIILSDDAMHISVSGLAKSGFERRFFLKYDEPLIRFRLLDINDAFSDISVPLSQFSTYQVNVDTVFITENKVNGLSFPALPSSMVVFGLGYGIEMLKGITWLKGKQIIYWGDIDTHGFAILSQLRSYFPQSSSLCMDEASLIQHKDMWGNEPSDKRCSHDLQYLTPAEQTLFQRLQSNYFGNSIRLEQERVRHIWLRQQLQEL